MASSVRFTIKVVIAMLWISTIHVHDGFAATTARLRSVTQLRVFDSTGKLVGPVLQIDALESAIVGFKVGNYTFPLTVTRDGFSGVSSADGPFFTTANCTGNAYLEVSPNEPFPPFLLSFALGKKKIYIQEGGPAQPLNLVSFFDLAGPGTTCNTFPQVSVRSVVPTVLLIDNLDAQFIAPFTLE